MSDPTKSPDYVTHEDRFDPPARRRPSESVAAMERRVDEWNAEHHVIGAAVIITLDDGKEYQTFTRSAAQIMNGHSAVIWVEGISGCYLLDRVRYGRTSEMLPALVEKMAAGPGPCDENAPLPADARCQEASILSVNWYVPCGKVACAIVRHKKDGRAYYMCGACADHNIRNRGGELLFITEADAPK